MCWLRVLLINAVNTPFACILITDMSSRKIQTQFPFPCLTILSILSVSLEALPPRYKELMKYSLFYFYLHFCLELRHIFQRLCQRLDQLVAQQIQNVTAAHCQNFSLLSKDPKLRLDISLRQMNFPKKLKLGYWLVIQDCFRHPINRSKITLV